MSVTEAKLPEKAERQCPLPKDRHCPQTFLYGKYYSFNGKTAWREEAGTSESSAERQKYMLNAYRVLLTRARMGMVICVPEGNANTTAGGFPEDSTRLPEFYDGTYHYLKSLGLDEL